MPPRWYRDGGSAEMARSPSPKRPTSGPGPASVRDSASPARDALRYDRGGRGLSSKRASSGNRKAPGCMLRPPQTLQGPVTGTRWSGGPIRPPGNRSRRSTSGAGMEGDRGPGGAAKAPGMLVCAQGPRWPVWHRAARPGAQPGTAAGTGVSTWTRIAFAALNSATRRAGAPHLVSVPARSLSPDRQRRGVRPAQAPTCFGDRNRAGSSIVATEVGATTGPSRNGPRRRPWPLAHRIVRHFFPNPGGQVLDGGAQALAPCDPRGQGNLKARMPGDDARR